MGNGPAKVCIGPDTDRMVVFPSLSSVTSSYDLAKESAKIHKSLVEYASAPAKHIPYAGPALASLINYLGSLDFKSVNAAFRKAEIEENILDQNLVNYNAEVRSIRDCLTRLQRSDLSEAQTQSEISYALGRAKYLFYLFQDQHHLFHKYPLVSMPHLIIVINTLWATLQISSNLDPTRRAENDALLQEISSLVRSFVNRSISERDKSPGWLYVGFANNFLILDRPWNKLNESREWNDGIESWKELFTRSVMYQPEKRVINHFKERPLFANDKEYEGEDDYKTKLRGSYEKFYRSAFPISF